MSNFKQNITANYIYALTTVLLLVLSSSCVSRKKLLYLQQDESSSVQLGVIKDEKGLLYTQNETIKTDFDYLLVPGDVIGIQAFTLTPSEFNFFANAPLTFSLDPNGFIELPAVGSVELKGLTLIEAQDAVEKELKSYLKSPTVTITLNTPFEYTTIGDGIGTGKQSLQGVLQLHILDAIALSGGLTPYADRANIKIIRTEETGRRILSVNVLEDNLLNNENFYIQSGDIILVDPLPAQNIRENQLSTFTTIFGVFGSLTGIVSLIFSLTR